MDQIIIVIPTYNEKDTLSVLIRKIFGLRIPDLKIWVVDDNSPDGTGQLADDLAKTNPIKVIHREKKSGLGAAYADAFQKLLNTAEDHPEYIVQMDADLSHDPAAIPDMLKKISDCDLVLGSRYVLGGKIQNWDLLRRLISRFGNLYARLILRLPYKDLTGGFKCYRRKVLESIEWQSVNSVGYNFQIETTYKAHHLGYKICEIPITFTERKVGASKFNLEILLESFWGVLLLRLRK